MATLMVRAVLRQSSTSEITHWTCSERQKSSPSMETTHKAVFFRNIQEKVVFGSAQQAAVAHVLGEVGIDVFVTVVSGIGMVWITVCRGRNPTVQGKSIDFDEPHNPECFPETSPQWVSPPKHLLKKCKRPQTR